MAGISTLYLIGTKTKKTVFLACHTQVKRMNFWNCVHEISLKGIPGLIPIEVGFIKFRWVLVRVSIQIFLPYLFILNKSF